MATTFSTAQLVDDLVVLHGFRGDLETLWPATEQMPTLSRIASDPATARAFLRDAVKRIVAIPGQLKTNTDAPEALRNGLVALTGLGTSRTTTSAARRRLAAGYLNYDAESLRTTRQGRAVREHLTALAIEVAALAVERSIIPASDALSTSSINTGATSPAAVVAPSSRWRRTRREVVSVAATALAALLVAAGVALTASDEDGNAKVGSKAVSAQTGHLIAPPHAKPPEAGGAQLAGGQLFFVCDITRQKSCPNDAPKSPVKVHLGDVLQLDLMLHNGSENPLPLFRVHINLGSGQNHPISVSALMRWPETPVPNCQPSPCGDQGQVFTDPLDFSVAGTQKAALRYLSGSTQLLSETRHIANLPDGVTTYPGLLMANLGVPPSACFSCRQDFIRFLRVKARVVR